jgi:nucleotide-binding universal stress UspA family protein
MTMGIKENERQVTSNCRTATLLFVADFVTGRSDVLDFACELAERQNADLQLLHVIDPEHSHSSPDAQMDAQFSLDMLAQRARALRRSAVSLLSFGRPENVIPRRAAEVNASVVVLPLNGTAADRVQKKLVRRLRGKCDCPVLAVPRDIFLDVDAHSLSIRGLLSLVRQVCEGDRQSMRTLERVSDKLRSRAPLMIMPKSAYFLRR